MKSTLYWILENKDWLFSGLGIVIISIIAKCLFYKKKKPTIINNNYGLSAGDVKIIAESIFTQNFPKLQETARLEANKNKELFIGDFLEILSNKLNQNFYKRFENPDVQYALLEAMVISSRKDNSDKRKLLSNLMIERVKCDGADFEEIIYLEAIKSISVLTIQQIRLLTIIDILSLFIFEFEVTDTLDSKIEVINKYLLDTTVFTKTDIMHLVNSKLLFQTFPYEIDTQKVYSINNEKCSELIVNCKNFYNQHSELELNKYQLTSIGKAISQITISNLIDFEYKNINPEHLKLSDIRANNVFAAGDVSAYSISVK